MAQSRDSTNTDAIYTTNCVSMACRGLSSPSHAYCSNTFNAKTKKHSLTNQARSLPNRYPISLESSSGIPAAAAVIIRAVATASMDSQEKSAETSSGDPPMKLLFVEIGVGYDQHGQDITAAAMRACKDAISSNSIPAFRSGAIPGVNTDQMKLQIKLGVPRSTQQFLDIERVKSVFPYGKIVSFEVVDGGLICSSGVCLEAMGDKNDDCYVVNAAVYVGY